MRRSEELVNELRRVVRDERVLEAIREMPRERFVPRSERCRAYDNSALPIGFGQTISQPLVVARMLEILDLRPDDRVLDVGTGSGYHAALLARLAGQVWTIERQPELSARAAATLAELEIDNVTVLVGDGCEGAEEYAPFDAINVAAAADVEIPPALERQLEIGGRLVAPVGEDGQRLVLAIRDQQGISYRALDPVRFVPLIASAQAAPPSRRPPPDSSR